MKVPPAAQQRDTPAPVPADADIVQGRFSELSGQLRALPVAGLAFGPQPAPLRRHSEPSDPLGGTELDPDIAGRLTQLRGGGAPLPPDVARSMGDAFGANLDSVRIHTGPEPAQLAQSVQAVAFTQGADIYFGAGSYSPGTPSGQRLLAHELAHTVQQGGPRGSGGAPIIGHAADPAEAEADRIADSALSVLRRRAVDRSADESATLSMPRTASPAFCYSRW